jgi:hypothetical protein
VSAPPETTPFTIHLPNPPQVLLLGKYQYPLEFQASNHLGENLDVELQVSSNGFQCMNAGEWGNQFNFQPNEVRNLPLIVQPIIDGLGKIQISGTRIIHNRRIEQQMEIKPRLEPELILPILQKRCYFEQPMPSIDQIFSSQFDLGGRPPLDQSQTYSEVQQILSGNLPPEFQPLPPNDPIVSELKPLSEPTQVPISQIDPLLRDKALISIAFRSFMGDPLYAFEVIGQIGSSEYRIKCFYELFIKLSQKNPDIAVDKLMQHPEWLQDPIILYECMLLFAFSSNPRTAWEKLQIIPESYKISVQEKLHPIFHTLQEKVIEFIEKQPLGEALFQFSCIASQISPSLEYLASIVGNISPDLLSHQSHSNSILLFAFSGPIPLLPLISQIQNPPSYVIFPAREHLNEPEISHFRAILKDYVLKAKSQNLGTAKPISLFLIDFLPFLNTYSIVLGGNTDQVASLIDKLKKNAAISPHNLHILYDPNSTLKGEVYEIVMQDVPPTRGILLPVLCPLNLLYDFTLFQEFLSMFEV